MNKQKGLSVKSVVAIGIGAAIYVILARFTSCLLYTSDAADE